MASLQEIRGLFSDSTLTEKVQAAIVIAANDLLSGTPTAAEKAWAAGVFADPVSESRKGLLSVLAANNTASVAQIQGATDTTIQNNINAVVPILVDVSAGV